MGEAGDHADNMGKRTGKLGGAMRGLGMVAGGVALVGVAAIGAGLVAGVKSAIEHEKAMAQTEAVVKSTGGSAKVSAKHVVGLADQIEKMSGMDDLAIQSGENMLLTFTNIQNGAKKGNKIFDETTKVLADMSTAMGTDPQKQAIALGKALNDPVKGMTALSKVGVSFTLDQKEQIKTLVEGANKTDSLAAVFPNLTQAAQHASVAMFKNGESVQEVAKHLGITLTPAMIKTYNTMTAGGHTMKAQKLILGELNKEFGGSAAAAGQTMGGQVKILQAHLEDLEQSIGEKILPILNQLVGWAIANFPTFQKYAEIAMQGIADAWNNVLKPVLEVIITVIGTMVEQIRAHWDQISAVFEAYFKIITGIIDAFIALFKGDWSALWTAIKQILTGGWDLIKAELRLVIPIALAILKAIGQKMIEGLEAGLEGLGELALKGLKAIPGALIGLHVLLFDAAKSLGGKLWDGIKEAVSGIAGDVADYFAKIPEKLRGLIESLKGAAGDLGKGIIDGIGSGLVGLGKKLKDLLIAPINAVISGWNNIEFDIPKIDTHIPGVGKVGGGSVGTPDIPLLAEGGIVTGPTLAILGEAGPEAVVPLGVKKNFSTGAGSLAGSDVGGDIVMVVDGVEIGRIARKELTRTGRRNVGLVFS